MICGNMAKEAKMILCKEIKPTKLLLLLKLIAIVYSRQLDPLLQQCENLINFPHAFASCIKQRSISVGQPLRSWKFVDV